MKIKIENTEEGRGRLTTKVEMLGKAYFGDTFCLRQLRLLPYIWNRVNETGGVLDVCRINVQEYEFLHQWKEKGFLKFIGRSICKPYTDMTKVRFDKRQMQVEVTKDFYDKMIHVLILANYITDHNRTKDYENLTVNVA